MIDSHIHLDDPRFDDDRCQLLQQARAAGVSGFVVPATVFSGFEKIKSLAQSHSDVFPAFGLHPYFADQHKQKDVEKLVSFLQNNQAVALGECGLDFHRDDLDRDQQIDIFEQQVEIAKDLQLPLILHVNGAVQAVFEILKKHQYFDAVMHSFNGSVEQARQITETGVILGFGTAVVNPKARKLHQVVKSVDIENMVIETDAPDQPLYDKKHQRNLPVDLCVVAEFIAQCKGITETELCHESDANCRRVFAL
ncbi:MAG: TatD family hydrolase [Proteobacteria bacterium]|nr:TatD family hydrolase [Pseudomonadota bacterium]